MLSKRVQWPSAKYLHKAQSNIPVQPSVKTGVNIFSDLIEVCLSGYFQNAFALKEMTLQICFHKHTESRVSRMWCNFARLSQTPGKTLDFFVCPIIFLSISFFLDTSCNHCWQNSVHHYYNPICSANSNWWCQSGRWKRLMKTFLREYCECDISHTSRH